MMVAIRDRSPRGFDQFARRRLAGDEFAPMVPSAVFRFIPTPNDSHL